MDNSSKTAVILVNMGGPENLSEVRTFLQRLFNDKHIIGMPQPLRFFFSRIMAKTREKNASHHYQQIGGGSPLKKWTSAQADKLKQKINKDIYRAYSYSSPLIKDTLQTISEKKYDRIIIIPLYPQYSITTFGSIIDDVNKYAQGLGLSKKIVVIEPFYQNDIYIQGCMNYLNQALEKLDRTEKSRVIFTAHSLPQSVIDKGDPYQDQIIKTVELILEHVELSDYVISYQSKIGPVKWLQPSTVDTVIKTAQVGIRQLVVMPIGFVCDHIETLYELDIELREIADKHGVNKFIRADVFNDDPVFIDLLSDLARKALDE